MTNAPPDPLPNPPTGQPSAPSQTCPAAGRRDCPSPPCGRSEDEPIRQFLARLERGMQHVESRIDRLYIAVGGGTVLLAAIGLAAGFIARGA